jgi:hypothetical protein
MKANDMCYVCGKEIIQGKKGRKRKYCSKECAWKCPSKLEYKKKYSIKNSIKLAKKSKKWREDNSDKVREYKKIHPYHNTKENNRKYNRKLHDRVIDFLGGKCLNPNCAVIGGMTDKRCLDVNHIEFGGSQETKKIGTGQFYRNILLGKRKINDLEIRCSNCNRIYNWEGKGRER